MCIFLDFVKLEVLGFCIIHYKTTKENMSKIALETEVYAIGGKSSPVAKKCCTKARAETLGCKIRSGYSYKDNQLIEQESYEKNVTYYIGIPSVNKPTNGIDRIWPFKMNTIPTTKLDKPNLHYHGINKDKLH